MARNKRAVIHEGKCIPITRLSGVNGLSKKQIVNRWAKGFRTYESITAPISNAIPRKEKICPMCGEKFKAAGNSGKGKQQIYCSKRCGQLALVKVQGLYCKLPEITSVMRASVCGHYVRLSASGTKYCSTTCATKYAKIERLIDLGPLSCKECGVVFTPITGARIYCGHECSKRHTRRIHKAKRRALERNGCEAEEVNPYEVFARDRWVCQGCQRGTPRELRGTLDPAAPELDHVIPLSKGGSHTMGNLQLLCRKCNGEKGDKLNWRAA